MYEFLLKVTLEEFLLYILGDCNGSKFKRVGMQSLSLIDLWHKRGKPFFQPLYVMKLKTSNLKLLEFGASEDIITKFKSQGLYTIKIKY